MCNLARSHCGHTLITHTPSQATLSCALSHLVQIQVIALTASQYYYHHHFKHPLSHTISLFRLTQLWSGLLLYGWMLQSADPNFDCLCRRRCWQSTSPCNKTSPNSCHLASEPVTMLHSCPCSNGFMCWSWCRPVIVPVVGSKQLVGWYIYVGGHHIGKQLVWQ
jgi:hypothetical protein